MAEQDFYYRAVCSAGVDDEMSSLLGGPHQDLPSAKAVCTRYRKYGNYKNVRIQRAVMSPWVDYEPPQPVKKPRKKVSTS